MEAVGQQGTTRIECRDAEASLRMSIGSLVTTRSPEAATCSGDAAARPAKSG